jgi:hypothetical protein
MVDRAEFERVSAISEYQIFRWDPSLPVRQHRGHSVSRLMAQYHVNYARHALRIYGRTYKTPRYVVLSQPRAT